MVELGTRARSTGSTSANQTSSRSHSILQITLSNNTSRRLSLIDLAGSERGADTSNSDRRTRQVRVRACVSTLDC